MKQDVYILQRLGTLTDTDKVIILQIVLDKACRAILNTIDNTSKSVSQISTDCNISLCTTYRKIRFMIKYDLLDVSCKIKSDGKKSFLYKNKIKEIKVSFNNENLNVHVITNRVDLSNHVS